MWNICLPSALRQHRAKETFRRCSGETWNHVGGSQDSHSLSTVTVLLSLLYCFSHEDVCKLTRHRDNDSKCWTSEHGRGNEWTKGWWNRSGLAHSHALTCETPLFQALCCPPLMIVASFACLFFSHVISSGWSPLTYSVVNSCKGLLTASPLQSLPGLRQESCLRFKHLQPLSDLRPLSPKPCIFTSYCFT